MLFTHRFLQRHVLASLLFPKMPGDGFKSRGFKGFPDFYASLSDRSKPNFSEAFIDCEGAETAGVTTTLASTGQIVPVDLVAMTPTKEFLASHPNLPGIDHHIVSFPAAFDYYESMGCLTDISLETKATGATVHTFNYPGIHRSKTGRITEFNDLVNTGIAVVNKLLRDGVHPDKIILQGDCYGTAVAFAVQQEFAKKDIMVRFIAANTFGSFKDTAAKTISEQPKALGLILTKSYIRYLLKRTGWNIKVGADFIDSGPYKAILQRDDDKTLGETTLLKRIAKYAQERMEGRVKPGSKRTELKPDTCPEEYKAARDQLGQKQLIKLNPVERRKEGIKLGASSKLGSLIKRVKGAKVSKSTINKLVSLYVEAENEKDFIEQADKRFKTKNSVTFIAMYKALQAADTRANQDNVDAHPLSLHQFDGAFEYIAEYLALSNAYIKKHPQKMPELSMLPEFKKTGVPPMTVFNLILKGVVLGVVATGIFLAVANPVVLPMLANILGVAIPSIAMTHEIMAIGGLTVFTATTAIASSFMSYMFFISLRSISRIKDAISNLLHRPRNHHEDKLITIDDASSAPSTPRDEIFDAESTISSLPPDALPNANAGVRVPITFVRRPPNDQSQSDDVLVSSREEETKRLRKEIASGQRQYTLA